MRRRIAIALASAGLPLLFACSERGPQQATEPFTVPRAQRAVAPGTCITLSDLKALANQVFGAGSPDAQSVLGKIDNLQHQIDIGDFTAARDRAIDIVSFTLSKWRDATHPLPSSEDVVTQFVNAVLCYGGLDAAVGDANDAWVVVPSPVPDTLITNNGQAGIIVPGTTFSEPTLITAAQIPDTFSAPGAGPLDTKLDQYPGFYAFAHSSANDVPLNNPVVVAVCATGDIAPDVAARLRLGHDASFGFEITPPADGSFLDCGTATAQLSPMSRLFHALASLVSPRPLYAAMLATGGVGGTASEFSPFAPVDPTLSFSGGVGGTASEFQRSGGTLHMNRVAAPNGSGASRSTSESSCSMEAELGAQIDTACRPAVTITTALGTQLEEVPVGWQIGEGGGMVARDSASICGTFGSAASTTTDATGTARVCWSLGNTLGTNTVIATPSAGGDAPAGVSFTAAHVTFTAQAVRITPTATANGVAVRYDGLPHGGTAACSNQLTPAVSYAPGGSALPVDAGTYTLTVTCGDGEVRFNTVSAQATIQIDRGSTTSTIACPATTTFTNEPLNVCTGRVTGPLLDMALTPTYSGNVGTVMVTVNYAGDANRLPSSASTTVGVHYVQDNCFASPIYSVMPSTKSAQRQGSNLPVKCSLEAADGSPVRTATGDLTVQDRGLDGSMTSGPVMTIPGAFGPSNNGTYSYGLDTSPAFFVSGHYYHVVAAWNDASTTAGWFYVK